MTTIQIEAQVSPEQLLRAVEQLPSREFSAFVDQILALRARRDGSHLSEQETALLLQINEHLAEQAQRRFDELTARRRAETITPQELEELMQITEQVEQRDAQRLEALDALARLRKVTLTELLDTLGIRPPTYA